MASITKEKNGRRTIQFVGADGRRRSIRLGKVSQRIAENVKVRVELLSTAVINGQAPDADTARWVASLDSVMQDKLARVGLVPKSETAALHDFIDGYITSRVDVKPNTTRAWRQTLTHLCEFFGADTSLRVLRRGHVSAKHHTGRRKGFPAASDLEGPRGGVRTQILRVREAFPGGGGGSATDRAESVRGRRVVTDWQSAAAILRDA